MSGYREKDGASKLAVAALGAVVATGLILAGVAAFTLPPGEGAEIAVVGVKGAVENFELSHRVAGLIGDNSVKGIVLEVDSPGGYVGPSFQLEEAICELSRVKPTVAVVEEEVASGAYLAASAADNLYVHHESLVGGLGVIAVWVSLENKFEEKGIEHYVFKTGPHKDMFAPWRGPTPEEENMIRDEVWSIMNRMIHRIKVNRPQLENGVPPPVIGGDVVRGFEAVELGLADNVVLTNEEAVEGVAEAAGLKEGAYEVVRM